MVKQWCKQILFGTLIFTIFFIFFFIIFYLPNENYLRDSVALAFFYAFIPTIFYLASVYSELD